MSVGIRELKAHLSAYIEQVRRGQSIVITDRGKPVARLASIALQPDHDQLPAKWRQLIETGKVINKGPLTLDKLPRPLPPLLGGKSLSDLIIEERDESVRRYKRPGEDPPE